MKPRQFQAQRFPNWIRKALALIDTNVPAALATDKDQIGVFAPIWSMIDVFQGGIGIADPIVVGDTQTVAAGATLALTPQGPSEAFGYLILGMAWTANALAATRNPVLAFQPINPFASDVGIRVAQVAIATGATLAWKDIAGTADARVWVPPGFAPIVYANDLAAAETITVKAALLKVAAGFKPF